MSTPRRFVGLITGASAVFVAGCGGAGAQPSSSRGVGAMDSSRSAARVPSSAESPGASRALRSPVNGRLPGRDYANTRYSPLDQITAENAEDLRVAWTFSTGVNRGHEGPPLVVEQHDVRRDAVPEHPVCARS